MVRYGFWRVQVPALSVYFCVLEGRVKCWHHLEKPLDASLRKHADDVLVQISRHGNKIIKINSPSVL